MAAITIPMAKIMKQVTLHMVVTGAGRTRVRLWIGAKLLRFAGAVIGCGVEVVTKPEDDGFRPLAGGPRRPTR